MNKSRKILTVLSFLFLFLIFPIMTSCGSNEENHVHEWSEIERTEATCTSNGEISYSCTGCEEIKHETIKATGHTEVIDKAVSATCTSTGLTEGKHCSKCNTIIIKQKETELAKHNYIDGKCNVCGTDEPDEYPLISIRTALSKPDGEKVSVSGTVFSINTNWNGYDMSVTIVGQDLSHLYIYKLKTEVDLGDIITVKGVMDTYNGRQIGAGATAEITGHDSKYSYNEMSILDALKSPDNTNVIVTGTVYQIQTPYSEQYNNISVYISDEQGHYLFLYRLIGNVEVGQKIKVKGAISSHNGNKQLAGGTFELCSEHICKNFTEATCTELAKCTECGETTGKLAPHTEVIDKAIDATCTSTGLTEGKHCSVCEAVLVAQEEIAALGHNYTSVKTLPTCTEQGYTTHTCSCGDTKVDSYVEAVDHSFGQVTYTWNANNTEVIAHHTCTRDNYVVSETVAVTSEITTEATCTTDGVRTYTSAAFTNSAFAIQTTTETIEALGHNYVWVVDKEATVLEPGLKHEDCTHCGNVRNASTIIPVITCAHTNSLEAHTKVEATCTSNGSESYWYCRACHKYYSDADGQLETTVNNIVIKATGHT
jgi:IS1 family transposase